MRPNPDDASAAAPSATTDVARHGERPLRLALATLLALALVLGVQSADRLGGVAAAAQPSSAPAATAPGAKKIMTTKQKVKALRAKVRKTDAVLTAQAKVWEASRDALVVTTREHARTESLAVAARAEAARAQTDLGKFAAAAYRGLSLPTELVMLVSPPTDVGDTLHGLQTLEHSGQVKVDVVSRAQQSAERATTLTAEAADLRNDAAVAAYRLDGERSELLAAMNASRKQLAKAVDTLAVLEARRLDAGCLARAKVAAEFPNGMIPSKALCAIDVGGYLLRGDAAVAFKKLRVAYEKDLDAQICVTSAYRTRELQAVLFADDPVMVAAPGRSQHGMGLALDLCGGIQTFGSEQFDWMKKHAGTFGWFHPAWAEPEGVTPEPWHWEFDPTLLERA